MKQQYTTLDLPGLNRFSIGFEQLFDELHRTADTQPNNNYPPYNVIRLSATDYRIEIAVAGFAEDEMQVEVANHELVITGKKKAKVIVDEEEWTDPEYLHRGIGARDFERAFALAENVEVKDGTVTNGILSIELELIIPESAKPKQVKLTFVK